MKRVLQVEGFIYNEKKDEILVVRKKDLSWGFSGGIVELDETMEETLIKKIKAQTNVDITIESLLFFKERRMEWEHVCKFVFRGRALGDLNQVGNDESVFRAKWLSVPIADDLVILENTKIAKLVLNKGVEYESCNEFPNR